MAAKPTRIVSFNVRDIRFPTKLTGDGSDAVNDPDYSCAYVTLGTDTDLNGYGITFTLGKGTDLVCDAVRWYCKQVQGRQLSDIYSQFGQLWQELAHEPQFRWLGPEKGLTHMALGAVMNALWDLWAKMENKPMWKLLADMSAETLVSTIDFRYIDDVISREEAIALLKQSESGKEEREKKLKEHGYPAYTTSVGWMGYSDDKIKRLCKEALDEGFTRFKVKIGLKVEDDKRRLGIVRREVGTDKMVMTDANQRWSVGESIAWMQELAPLRPHWIEEPTSPDDILGHATIAKALEPLGIKVATGEACQNRVMFKQFLQAGALHYCQVDSCRMGGPNEVLAVYLMAAKLGVKVCPHAGGVGLCELVRHYQFFDYIRLSGSMDDRVIEYVDHLHEHFLDPAIVSKGNYIVPEVAGFSTEMKSASLAAFEYPQGAEWQQLFADGRYERPQ